MSKNTEIIPIGFNLFLIYFLRFLQLLPNNSSLYNLVLISAAKPLGQEEEETI